jgi:hypothetical protein
LFQLLLVLALLALLASTIAAPQYIPLSYGYYGGYGYPYTYGTYYYR